MNRTAGTNLLTARLTALSDPVRLRLLRLLEREELSVGELAKVVQLPQSTVSRHLKILAEMPGVAGQRQSGWLAKRAEGTATLYRLTLDDLSLECRALWVAVREQMGNSPELSEDLRRLASILTERRTDTQAFFGRVAGEWDSVRNDLFGDRFTIAGLLPLLPRHWTVLDLGCGTGNASELLAPVVQRVIAVDQSQPMLAAARKRLEGIKNVEFLRGELDKLPLGDASVDATVTVLVLHHLPDPSAACREMARVLRPGGVALIIDMVEHDRSNYRHTMGHRWQGFSEPSMHTMLTQAGLVRPRTVVLPSDTGAKGPGLFSCTAFKPEGKAKSA